MAMLFDREALYREVWASPLTKLAKNYGLSDNGLRKICVALEIPLPKIGYWARIQAGQRQDIPPLPPSTGRTTFLSEPRPQTPDFGLPEDDQWLVECEGSDANPDTEPRYDPAPKRWHPAVAPLRDDHREVLKELPRWKRDFERQEKHKGVWMGPDFKGGYWQPFLDKGQVLIDTHKAYPMRVSPQTVERALSILNALCWNAERRGFSVTLNEKEGRIVLDGHGGSAQLRITERLSDDSRVKFNSWSKKSETMKTKAPSGLLRLYVGRSYAEREVSESKELPLESRLREIFLQIYRHIVRCRREHREYEARELARREEAKRQAELEELRRKEHEARETERKRRLALVEQAKAWETANLIRRYVDYVASTGTSEQDAEWHAWALAVACDIESSAGKCLDKL